jgi:hypothetical protein
VWTQDPEIEALHIFLVFVWTQDPEIEALHRY